MPQNRVLIIEDNPDAAEALVMLLRAAGHTVATAASGIEGLETAREFHPGVVVSDIRLPGALDGLELASRPKADPALRDALLVGLSGFAGPEQRGLALRAGFDHYLAKPVDP